MKGLISKHLGATLLRCGQSLFSVSVNQVCAAVSYDSEENIKEQEKMDEYQSDGDLKMEQDGENSVSTPTPTDHNNLIVNYLPDTMTQADLQKMFESFGEIESCKLIMNKVSGHSMGYGFVKFRNHGDAQNALNNLDGLMLQHKKIKVSFARPANEPIKTANVYVSGLKNTITEADLISMFSKYGKVLTVKVMNNNGDARKATAIGFVRFEKHQCAENAIQNLDQTKPLDNPTPIHVSFAKQSKDNTNANSGMPNPVLSMPFTGYGNTAILNNVLPKSLLPFPGSKFPQNIGKSPTFTGKNLRFDPLGKNVASGFRANMGDGLFPIADGLYAPAPEGKGFVIFVFNLNPDVEEVQLWRLFGPFGAITQIKIVYDKETKKSKGFAFVTMPNFREAEIAIRSLNKTTFEGKVLQVSFKKERNQN